MPAIESEPLKVVAHLRDGKLLKGYMNQSPGVDMETLQQQPLSLPENFAITSEGSGEILRLSVSDLKALFFVKRFEGRTNYNEVKFFTVTPEIEGLWVRIRFYDNETTEGIIHNSIHSFVSPAFFLKPPDPLSNNEIAYILKSSLVEYRVLGVKTSY
jgi:hypothetical protein